MNLTLSEIERKAYIENDKLLSHALELSHLELMETLTDVLWYLENGRQKDAMNDIRNKLEEVSQ